MSVRFKYRLISVAVSVALLGNTPAYAGLFDFLPSNILPEPDAPAEKETKPTAPQKNVNAAAQTKESKCGDLADELLKTKTMSATELMGELRNLKFSFATGNPMRSLNAMMFGASAVSAAAKSPTNTKQANASKKKAVATKKKDKETAIVSKSSKTPALSAPKDDGCKPAIGVKDINAIGGLLTAMDGGITANIASSLSDVILDALIAELSFAAIETLLTQLLDNKDVLSKISVDIPEVASFNPELRKQVLNLGGYLVAIKGSNLMIESAQNEFIAAKESYKKVMELRTRAADALKEAFGDKEKLIAALDVKKTQGKGNITQEQMDYAEKLLEKNAEDFFSNYEVQQIAIAYLRTKPDRKSEIVEMNDANAEFKSHYGAYARTAAGAASMVGFSALFLKKTKSIVEKQGIVGGAALIPLLIQGGQEVSAMAANVKKVFNASDSLSEGSFRIEKDGQDVKRNISFERAVGMLDDDTLAVFKSDLVRDDKSGYLSKLFVHSSERATALADHVTNKEDRIKVAEAFEVDDPDIFTFTNALSRKSTLKQTDKSRIANIFQSNIKIRNAAQIDEEDAALEVVQQKMRNDVTKYSNSTARHIMFALAGKSANYSIKTGSYRISVDHIGMDGLYDQSNFFESQTQHNTTRQQEETPTIKLK